MCKGTSFCDNKEDLRLCKNETRWKNATPLDKMSIAKDHVNKSKARNAMMGSLIHTKYKFEGYPIIFLLVVSLGGKQLN